MVIKLDDGTEVKRIKLLVLTSDKYDFTNEYLYVGSTTDEEIINDIDTTNSTSSSIINNELIITDGTNEIIRYKLVIINSEQYVIGSDYIYNNFKNIDVNYIEAINADLEILDNKLNVKYNEEIIKTIPIFSIIINSTNIKAINNKIALISTTWIDYDTFYEYFEITANDSKLNIDIYDIRNDLLKAEYVEPGCTLKVTYNGYVIKEYKITEYKDYIRLLAKLKTTSFCFNNVLTLL